jgi:exo-1,4-beta-D-glucosaminidase
MPFLSAQAADTQSAAGKMVLSDGWSIQSSANDQEPGDKISTPGYAVKAWQPATVPSTVAGILVQNDVYKDPFWGMNIRALPGVEYRIGTNFSNVPMPENSPFKSPWWYRREFTVNQRAGELVWLHFDGINFRANIWLNGKRIADNRQVAGAYRTYEFNITGSVQAGKPNALAVEIFPPEPTDLAITWVDWNPMPPDKNMGLWRDVYITTSGPVSLRYPAINTRLDPRSSDKAHLTISADLHNAGDRRVNATLKGRIEKIEFHQNVDLAANETKTVTFSPDKFLQLNISQPRLWWPVHMGPQNLQDLELQAEADGKVSDSDKIRFGIREVTSELSDKNYRTFKINGMPVLIRGAGYTPDMFLRPSLEREIAEIRYVKDMNLNTIRFEAKMETGRFLEMMDREGILAIAGWCCCDHWEKWDKWDEEDYQVSAASLRDQIRRIRNHPSVFTWWNGSDGPPNERAEKGYLAVLEELRWANPVLSSATAKPAKASGQSGVRMTGPYEYVPPVYWYLDTKNGGAYSFNTETGPGPAVPPIESLKRMIPRESLWPINEVWNFHAGGGAFRDIKIYTEALNQRLGTATGVEDFAMKSQVMAYDGERAMFEAYARNKYLSNGVIQWMLNNAWPAIIWHLYDYYLRPAGGYFGTKKACEPVHIQYSYDDRSVVVVSSYSGDLKGLKAGAKVYNLDMTEKSSQEAAVDATADCTKRVLTIPDIAGLSSTYFVKLTLTDSAGKLLSSNFYWLSTKQETLDWDKTTWYYTPTKEFADFTALKTLPAVDLKVRARTERRGAEEVARVSVENPSKSLAFFVRLKVNGSRDGEEILPVIWQDNYFSLLPGEKRELTATYDTRQLLGAAASVEVQGWNIAAKTVAPVK